MNASDGITKAKPIVLSVTVMAMTSLAWWSIAHAETPSTGVEKLSAAETAEKDSECKLQIAAPTLGGMYYWADEAAYFDWRIQRNVLTNHYRLLNGSQQRQASGTFEQCQAALTKIRERDRLPPQQGKVVILLHGLGGNRLFMNQLASALRKEKDWTVCNATYPSMHANLDEHAKSLGRLVSSLSEVEEISLVAHSMGNLVIRRWWAMDSAIVAGGKDRPVTERVKRIVMIGAPNHGATLADHLAPVPGVSLIMGPAVRQLGPDWKSVEPNLATPSCEFGVISGGMNNEHGFNPALPGDDDGIVSVKTTRLAGASDFLLVKGLHNFLPSMSEVRQATISFLKEGYFVAADKRQPIAK